MKHIKYASQNVSDSDIKIISKVLRDEFLTQGPNVSDFENKLKKDLVLNIALLLQVVVQL